MRQTGEDDVSVFCRRLATIVACLLALGAAQAQELPNRPIRLIVGFPAGGPTDFVARIVADKVATLIGQPVVIENRPGANGTIGGGFVARSEPDGTVLYFSTSSAITIMPSLRSDLPYDPSRDFAPITLVVNTSEVLVVNPRLSVHKVDDLIKLAREKPGSVAMASTGTGGITHLALELLQAVSGARILHVPYRGAAPAITDLLGGQVVAMFADLPVVMPHVKSGQLRPIATASRTRTQVLPDLATLDEQGYPGVYADNWYGLFAPARTTPTEIARLNAVVGEALEDPAVRGKLLAAGAVPAAGTPEALAELVKSDLAAWHKLITEKGIRLSD
jgi:tripartite-type tricarboxylate transporter receptor subunit TctC